ncbi:MAG: hypothetical protein U0R26_05860 [Solirubrobacterales bacterium]
MRGLLQASAGFSLRPGSGEPGGERELLGVCRDAGMRLVNRNCLGVIDTAPEPGLNASFAPNAPPPGSVGFVTQVPSASP